jgi:hypothetical protein
MVVSEPPATRRRRVGFIQFPLRYYLGAALAIVGVFATLRIASGREVDRSDLASYCHSNGGAP